ncbi:mitochondrial 37S ribosomal protein rsm10 [Dissophora globulifera]|uniref:Small ribosomal subunit protein uS10m n=1 Tax=Dissophora globulifera TaxID=979702 RepID=A0A9P6RV51_9FUNG|nr:mitochondrial 37S ribosomal protein rsm10 [Dissophora globulifera]
MLSTLKTGLSVRGLNAVKFTSIATRSFSTPVNGKLPEEISEQDRLVYAEPIQIPTTHNITVAHLHLRSYLPGQLDFFADFARRAAAALEMPCSGTIPLPVQTSKWTVNKSPFVYKKAQETFERKTHKRLLAIKDTHPDVVRRWVQFLNQNSIAGVGMKVTIWENEELGIGQKRLDKVKKGESRNRSVAEMMGGAEQGVDINGLENQQPSDDVKAVADQLLAQMMKDIGGEEEIAAATTTTSTAAETPASGTIETVTEAIDFGSTASTTNVTAADDINIATEAVSFNATSTATDSKSSTTTTTQADPSSSPDVSHEKSVPTESHLAQAIEPVVTGSSTLDTKLSEAVEKAVAETATKADKA